MYVEERNYPCEYETVALFFVADVVVDRVRVGCCWDSRCHSIVHRCVGDPSRHCVVFSTPLSVIPI